MKEVKALSTLYSMYLSMMRLGILGGIVEPEIPERGGQLEKTHWCVEGHPFATIRSVRSEMFIVPPAF